MNGARRQAWTAIGARQGALPGVRIADKVLDGVTCIRLDATVTQACLDKELAEPNFKGFGITPCSSRCTGSEGARALRSAVRPSAGCSRRQLQRQPDHAPAELQAEREQAQERAQNANAWAVRLSLTWHNDLEQIPANHSRRWHAKRRCPTLARAAAHAGHKVCSTTATT